MNLNAEQRFATVPTADIPRSVFDRSYSYKTTMRVNDLVPIFVDEALPGDSFKMKFTVFGRLINPLVAPVMDELYFETLWFKCPNRLLWSNWKKFCGEQDNPEDSTDYIVPVINSGTGFAVHSLADYFGIPIGVANLDVNALPFRMYNLTYNQWFRDENLINSVTVPLTDSDSASNYSVLHSAKMHDYFTSSLPFAQKGDPVMLPLGGEVPVVGTGDALGLNYKDVSTNPYWFEATSGGIQKIQGAKINDINTSIGISTGDRVIIPEGYPIGVSTDATKSGLVADMSGTTSVSVNDLRFAFQLQKYKERNARSGTRYPEYVLAHFGVKSPDARQQRVEFLGSTRTMIDINTVIQTSSTDSTSPQGTLSAYAVVGKNGYAFSTSFTEHSYVMGIARIRHNPIYQQGLHKMWSRSTLIDFYDPVFACIGEQPVLNKEIYAQGKSVVDTDGVTIIDDKGFGFQEAWAEYRYRPSQITGYLRSTLATGSLDLWHFAQEFQSLPVLNQSFIEENIPLDRAIAYPGMPGENPPQFLMDFSFNYKCARPMPVRSVPGLVDHF